MIKNIEEIKNSEHSSELKNEERKKMEFSIYLKYSLRILKKVKVIKFIQLVEILRKKFDISSDLARSIVFTGEYKYMYLISSDWYILDYEYYRQITGDVFYDYVYLKNKSNKLPIPIESIIPEEDKELISALSVVANSMPLSEDFVCTIYPWTLMFAIENLNDDSEEVAKGCLYQIAYFTKTNARTKSMMIKETQKISEENRDFVKRIAIVTSPELCEEIPYCGFSKIIMIKDDKLEIIENREETWE